MAKKQQWTPNLYSLIFLISIGIAALTWIIPAGSFDRVTEGATALVVPDTFHFVEKNPQNIWDIFKAIITGFKNQTSLVLLIFFGGTAIFLLESTKALHTLFSKAVCFFRGKDALLIFLVMGFMSIGGASGVFGNLIVVLVPFGIFLSQTMGYDKTLGFFMIFFGGFSGFNVGWANPGILGLAQHIAVLPVFSGLKVHIIIHIINFFLCYGFVLLYLSKIKKKPQQSLNYKAGLEVSEYMGEGAEIKELAADKIERKHIISALFMLACIAVSVIGSAKFKWNLDNISAAFLLTSFAIGIVNFRDLNFIMNKFIPCASKLVVTSFIVGFGAAIPVLLTDSRILDTIIEYSALPIRRWGPIVGVNLMLLENAFLNFFISDGPGLAAALMPILTPIADTIGITRQVAVQAFIFGDGFTNCIFPTVATLAGSLRFAEVNYAAYFKKAIWLILAQILLGMAAVTALQLIGWTGL